uniref:Bestrophin homolog n=1 Tax=Panagrolaimus superbus TaxID=310955 RepID=A0A914XVT0_9BILA
MTITYNIDVPYFGLKGILSLLFRWRGSVWIGITIPLILWLIAFYTVQVIYRYALRPYDQNVFDRIIDILKERTDSVLPMTFILGFFVTAVIKRWQKCLNNIGWIDRWVG